MASKNGVQKRASATKQDKGKTTKNATGVSPGKKPASKAPTKRTTVISSSDSESEEAFEPVKRKAAARATREYSIEESASESEAHGEGRRDTISSASGSDDDNEDLDTSLSSRRASTNHNSTTVANQSAVIDEGPPPIPQKLLTRLLYEGFEDKNVKIGREAMNVYGKYIETFVREALARAIYEREDADKEGGVLMDGFVQVEDLERITPQLLLDF